MNNQKDFIAAVPGYEGLYGVSRTGVVFHYTHTKIIYSVGSGYHRVTLIDKHGLATKHYVHLLIAQAFLGTPSQRKPIVYHINGNTLDNRVENLEYGAPEYEPYFCTDGCGCNV
jgi:hypothetical protein